MPLLNEKRQAPVQFIPFHLMDKFFAVQLFKICTWLARRMFTRENNRTSFQNSLYIYGSPGAGKTYLLEMIAVLFGVYMDTVDASMFVSP